MRKPVDILFAVAILGVACGICSGGNDSRLAISSPAFAALATIPARYTCSGEDVSPPLRWTGIPAGTKTLVLIVDDPDAPSGTFTHWIVYNIEPGSAGLAENALKAANPAVKYAQASNDSGQIGYKGPCPPQGARHHYHFKLYALSTVLHLPDDAKVKQVDDAMQGHILAIGQMIATFVR